MNWILLCTRFCILYYIIQAKPVLPSNYKETTWEKLRDAVHAIHNQHSISSSLEELYKAVENLCSHNMSVNLYDQLKSVCENHVKSTTKEFTWYPFQNYFELILTIVFFLEIRKQLFSYKVFTLFLRRNTFLILFTSCTLLFQLFLIIVFNLKKSYRLLGLAMVGLKLLDI